MWLAGEKLDPRAAVGGRFVSHEPPGTDATASTSGRDQSGQGHWQSGLFDKGSWIEAQSGWARSVVTGRARLAGVACGKLTLLLSSMLLAGMDLVYSQSAGQCQ